jgi:hypothetical protein
MPDYGKDGKDALWKKFLKMMGLSEDKVRNVRHHESTREIFANTFRILFSPHQHDFWPHKAKHLSRSKVSSRTSRKSSNERPGAGIQKAS